MQYEATRTYLSKLNGDRRRHAQYINIYSVWAKLDPQELLSLKLQFDPARYLDAERLLDRFAVDELVQLPCSVRWLVCSAVRGFYTKNYHRLEAQAGDLDYTPKKTRRVLSKRERFALFNACYTPRDKALVCFACCTAIALETMCRLKWCMFDADWLRQTVPHLSIGSEYLKGKGKGKYKGVRQETFITSEAKRVLLEYRDWYTKTFSYIWRVDDHVFLDVRHNIGQRLGRTGVNEALQDVADRAGVSFTLHDGRRIVNTALQNVECDPNWIQMCMGRKVPGNKSPYSLPNIEQLRGKYVKALGELEFLGEGYGGEAEWSEDEKREIRVLLKAVRLKAVKIDESKLPK